MAAKDPIIEEIHKIRAEMYREFQDLGPEAYIRRIHTRSARIARALGLPEAPPPSKSKSKTPAAAKRKPTPARKPR